MNAARSISVSTLQQWWHNNGQRVVLSFNPFKSNFFCHNHQTAVFCVIFKKVLFKIWKSRVWGRNGPGTYTMCLLRPGGTNRYHHAQHIMSVGTHMYQLHYYIKSVGTRAVESEVSSSDSNSYLDSGQFWLSDSNSDSGPTPTLSRITYLEW